MVSCIGHGKGIDWIVSVWENDLGRLLSLSFSFVIVTVVVVVVVVRPRIAFVGAIKL